MPRWNGPRAIRRRRSRQLKSAHCWVHILQWEHRKRREALHQNDNIPQILSNQFVMNTVDTFLPAIEHPRGLLMRLAYYFTRRQFGKVITPLKVRSARLPAAFGFFYAKIGKLDKKLTLSTEFVLLIREQVARINVCEFCMDIARSFIVKQSMNEAKFDALDDYGTSPLFSDAERAALDYAAELTRDKEVHPETF